MNKQYIVSGAVKFAGISNDDDTKSTVAIIITEEQAKAIGKAMELKTPDDGIESNPIKIQEDKETGEKYILFKASSKFGVDIYDKGKETDRYKITDIGEWSEVELCVSIKEIKYGRKVYQVAYMKSVNLTKFIQHVKFNAFEAKDDAAVRL